MLTGVSQLQRDTGCQVRVAFPAPIAPHPPTITVTRSPPPPSGLQRQLSSSPPAPFIPLNEDEIEAKEALESELAQTKAQLASLQVEAQQAVAQQQQLQQHHREEPPRSYKPPFEPTLSSPPSSPTSDASNTAFELEQDLNKLKEEHEILQDDYLKSLSKCQHLESQLHRGTSECVALLSRLEDLAKALKMPKTRAEPPPAPGKSANIVAVLQGQVKMIADFGRLYSRGSFLRCLSV